MTVIPLGTLGHLTITGEAEVIRGATTTTDDKEQDR